MIVHYKRERLREDKGRSYKFSKMFGRNLKVFWNNKYENWVFYLDGRYFMEFLTGQRIDPMNVKKKLHSMTRIGFKEQRKEVEKRIELNKEGAYRDDVYLKKDAKRDAMKFGANHAVSVVV